MAKYDLSDPNLPADQKVTRLVRPFCNLGPACGGDEVTLDASELRHPAVNDALWTPEELKKADKEAEEARRAQMRTVDTTAQQVNEQMKKAAEERKARKKRERVEDLAKFKDTVEALKELAG